MTPTGLAARPLPRGAEAGAAARELAKRIYRQYYPSLLARVEADVVRWIVHRLDSIITPAGGGTVLGLAVLALVAALAVRARLGPMRAGGRPAADGAGLSGPLPARQYRAEADRLAAAGDWAGAVVAAMRGLARGLEERDLLTAVPGLTATELAWRAGAVLPEARDPLRTAAATFDAVRFGGHAAGEPEFHAVRDADRAARGARPALPTAAGSALPAGIP